MTEAIKIDLEKEEVKKTEKTLSSNLLKKIMNDEVYDSEAREELLKTESNEEFVEVLMKYNPISSNEKFMEDYKEWAFNPKKNIKQLTFASRINSALANIYYGTPESQKLPFYFYYSLQDKVRSAPYHFNTDYSDFNKFRLQVNRYTKNFRIKVTNFQCVIIIVFGLAMGFVLKPIVVGYQKLSQIAEEVGKIRDNGEQIFDDYTKKYEEHKSINISKAKEVKTQYENGEITAEEFNTKALEIKSKDKELNDNYAKFKIENEAQINVDIALKKQKDNDYIQKIRDEKKEALKKLETKGE